MNIHINLETPVDKDSSQINTVMPILPQRQLKLSQTMKTVRRDLAISSQTRKKKKNLTQLKQLLKKQKIDYLVKQFVKKMKRLIPSHNIPQNLPISQQKFGSPLEIIKQKLQKCQGVKLPMLFNAIWSFFMLVKILITIFVVSVLLLFNQTQEDNVIQWIAGICVGVGVLDIFLLAFTERFETSYDLKNTYEILTYYIKNDFVIDFLSILALPLSFTTQSLVLKSITFLLQIPKFIKQTTRIQKFQNFYLTNIFQQKYYIVIKAVLFNFFIAHILATVLILMTKIDCEKNWMTVKNIHHYDWTVRYVWGCYWGVNIMLTVGFGDISANNQTEALVLIFLETVSCIVLAYNINTVGSVLADIKAKQSKRKRQLKVFYQMSAESKLQNSLKSQIMSSINQSFEIKQKFMYDQYDKIINSLPQAVSKQYKKQSNKYMFEDLPFIGLLTKKTILKLSQKIYRKIAHPHEIIIKKGANPSFIILNKGQLNYICRSRGSKLDGNLIQSLTIKQYQNSKLLSLNFLKNNVQKFDILSKGYSVLYYLSREQLLYCLKQTQRDYEMFCQWRDRDEIYLNDKEIYFCQFCCGEKHNQFQCPKMHYIPIKRIIIYKSLSKKKVNMKRKAHNRTCYKYNSLKNSLFTQTQLTQFIDNNNYCLNTNPNLITNPNINICPIQPTLYQNHQKPQITFRNIVKAAIRSRKEGQLKLSPTNIQNYSITQPNKSNQNLSNNSNQNLSNSNKNLSNIQHCQTTLSQKRQHSLGNSLLDIDKVKEILEAQFGQERNFWNVEADCCYNFGYYFRDNNVCYFGRSGKNWRSRK